MAIVRKSYRIGEIPEPSAEALARIDAIREEDIDYSDIPELTDEFFKNAKRISEFKTDKTRVTMRLDTDVVEWLKSQGKGYQTRANMILRAAMES